MLSPDLNNEEDFTNCKVCFGLFDLDESRPLFLQCKHTFCLKCLKKVQKENSVKCPLCRALTVIEDISDLPRNTYTEHIVFMHHHRGIEKDLGLLQWCFTCVSTGSFSCLREDHATINMSTHAENLNAKIAISSFQKDIENWKKVNEDLKTAFRTKPEFSEQIFKLMDDVDDKLDILSSQLSRFRFDPDQEETKIRRIQSHFERKNDVLSEAKTHRDGIQKKLREITQEPSGTPENEQSSGSKKCLD